MNLFDTTLRDGGNVVGDGFNKELTLSIVKGLQSVGITDIEFGNCKGIGAYEKGATNALTDDEYIEIVQPMIPQLHMGMFMVAGLAKEDNVKKAAAGGFHFLRVGNDAGNGKESMDAIAMVKKENLICRYSLMKAYVSTADELAEEAKMLEDAGVDKITIMDSAGTMFPSQVAEYVRALKNSVSIPIGFHGHSNLGMSQANALSAVQAGADEIDCGLLGMARSAGNCSTELAVATFQKEGYLQNIDFLALLSYLEKDLIPRMIAYQYHPAVTPLDIVLGISGCHSKFLPLYRQVSDTFGVSLASLIIEVSKVNRKNPDNMLMEQIAAILQKER